MVQAQTLCVDLPWGSENEGAADDTCYLPLKYHKIKSLETGVHNTEPATSLCSCQGLFTNQFIFQNDFGANVVGKTYRPENGILRFWKWRWVSFISYTSNALRTERISEFPGNNCTKMNLKINPSVKTSWQAYQGSCLIQVMGSCLSGLKSKQKRKNIHQQQQQLLWKVISEVLFLTTNCSAGEEHLSKIFSTLFQ